MQITVPRNLGTIIYNNKENKTETKERGNSLAAQETPASFNNHQGTKD